MTDLGFSHVVCILRKSTNKNYRTIDPAKGSCLKNRRREALMTATQRKLVVRLQGAT